MFKLCVYYIWINQLKRNMKIEVKNNKKESFFSVNLELSRENNQISGLLD